MTHRISVAAVMAILILIAILLPGPGRCGEVTDSSSKAASSISTFEGTLFGKETHGEILLRSQDGHQRLLQVVNRTMITRNGKPVDYREIQVGDRVRVKYDAERVVLELEASRP